MRTRVPVGHEHARADVRREEIAPDLDVRLQREPDLGITTAGVRPFLPAVFIKVPSLAPRRTGPVEPVGLMGRTGRVAAVAGNSRRPVYPGSP